MAIEAVSFSFSILLTPGPQGQQSGAPAPGCFSSGHEGAAFRILEPCRRRPRRHHIAPPYLSRRGVCAASAVRGCLASCVALCSFRLACPRSRPSCRKLLGVRKALYQEGCGSRRETGFRGRPQIHPSRTENSGRAQYMLVESDSHAQWWTSESMTAHARVYACTGWTRGRRPSRCSSATGRSSLWMKRGSQAQGRRSRRQTSHKSTIHRTMGCPVHVGKNSQTKKEQKYKNIAQLVYMSIQSTHGNYTACFFLSSFRRNLGIPFFHVGPSFDSIAPLASHEKDRPA